MEAAVRWSANGQRFLVVDVADPSLTLNQCDSIGRKSLTYRTISRCNKLPNFGAFDWSKTNESIIALGLVSGSASLVKLHEDSIPEITTSFRVKQQRRCNSIAFSTQDWLAVAVDKTRSDVCLLIYDASRNSSSSTADPVRRLCPAELVSSVRFFTAQPQEIVASTQRSFVRLYDLREGHLTTGNQLQVLTRNVHNLSIDPLDENYFASAGPADDPCVTVWDRRWISQSLPGGSTAPVFEFKAPANLLERTTIWSLRYSGQRRGQLAISSSNGELKIVDMVESCNSPLRTSTYPPINPHGGTPWAQNPYVLQTRTLEQPWFHERYGKDRKKRVVAFDWILHESSDAEQAVVAMRPDREVDILRFSASRPLASMSGQQDPKSVMRNTPLTETTATTTDAIPSKDFELRDKLGKLTVSNNGVEPTPQAHYLSYIPTALVPFAPQLERCKKGYGFDCQRNASIVAGNSQLEHLWEFIQRYRELAADDGMVCKGLDLSFVGVSGIWSETFGRNSRRILSADAATPDDAIISLNHLRSIPAFEGHRTNFPEHRQLCLAVCGWKFTKDDLELECQELIDRGLHYLAIVQAVLHGEMHMALNLLRDLIRTKTIQNIGLGAFLASDPLNDQQKEMCLWMSTDTDDPALKALLTFLTTGDWRDVMRTQHLHLGYRVALALKYLNDTELSNYIQSQTQRAVMNGNLEGVLLTGLGRQAMHLFQTYIARTNDLQTAVLATAFTNPLYVDDVRWEMWRDTYFQQMQAWKAGSQRSLFKVQHSQLAKRRTGKTLTPTLPPQVSLWCTHCRKPLIKGDGTDLHIDTLQSSKASFTSQTTHIARPLALVGTICPHCGRHMPRCGVCRLWLGMPVPSYAQSPREPDQLDALLAKLLSFCVTCNHGFHADHAKLWFTRNEQCPVPDCRCICGFGN